jgi:hypothetical protein
MQCMSLLLCCLGVDRSRQGPVVTTPPFLSLRAASALIEEAGPCDQ